MPPVSAMNVVPGVYRSDCCGAELTLPAFKKFPPCDDRKTIWCKRAGAEWALVRRTSPAIEREILPGRAV